MHSFACFLSTRPNEQIYNNATEKLHVVYVASLAGVIPGGPGHSHQAVRDIAALKGTPGMVMIEPSCEAEVSMALDYCLNQHKRSAYIRLCSVPWPVSFSLPEGYKLKYGEGIALTEGSDVAIFAYGPIMLNNAVLAANNLKKSGISAKVINLPWLNIIDVSWLTGELKNIRSIVTIDNHYLSGGQNETILTAAAEAGLLAGKKVIRFGLSDVPVCGSPAEVLSHHHLDTASICNAVQKLFAESCAA